MSEPIYLFRKEPKHIFITPKDPDYRYELLCGHCEYPIAPEDPQCPRCQRQLEECPVCSRATHTRAPVVDPNREKDAKTCPVCRVRRVQFGTEISGSYCTNVYGCAAGGLLLKSEEYAVLPVEATLCPVCRNEDLTPLDVSTFRFLLSHCLFCATCFGPGDSWTRGWSKAWSPSIESIAEISEPSIGPCHMCGRSDYRDGEDVVYVHLDPQGTERTVRMRPDHYLRVAELGRLLILEQDDKMVFRHISQTWFGAGRSSDPAGITVGEVATRLLEGTQRKPTAQILQRRLEHFVAQWERHPAGLGYRVESDRKQRS